MKPIYHQSQLSNWYSCPKKFQLSLTESFDQTKPMKMGNIFESVVFDRQKKELNWEQIRKGITIDLETAIWYCADRIRPIFIKGKKFEKIRYEGPHWSLEGEADYIGTAIYQGEKIKGIIDLKFTGNIAKIWGLGEDHESFGLSKWDGKWSRQDYFQSFAYPYMLAKNTGEIPNFYYLLVEWSTEADMFNYYPLTKLIDATPTAEDIEWFEEQVNIIHEDPFYEPNYTHCKGRIAAKDCGFYKNRKCEAFIKKFTKKQKLELSTLSF